MVVLQYMQYHHFYFISKNEDKAYIKNMLYETYKFEI